MEFRQALPVGSILADDYRITGVLGQGGFGLTYKADDARLGTPVAIKEYFPSELALRENGSTVVPRSSHDQSVLEWGRAKFLEEARTLARFRHPNIVRVARLFEANRTAYMVLDFEAGPSLAEWRAKLGRAPSQAEIDAIAAKLLDAVGVVHEAGLLHRDIKPANVIMRDGLGPVLIDFGAARQALSAQSRTVHAIVTPGYSPKEQYAVDLDRQGAWSDIYALGATLFFLVMGKTPRDALSRDLDDHMPMETTSGEAYRIGFLRAIDEAMSVRAEDRPQTVAELREALLADARPGPMAASSTLLNEGQPAIRQARSAPTVAGRKATGVAASARPILPERAAARGARSSAPRRVTFDDIASRGAHEAERGRSGGLAVAFVLVGVLALGGLWYWVSVLAPQRDEAAWQRAAAANTAAAYEKYLAEQPSGRHTGEAHQRRQVLAAATNRPGISLGEVVEPAVASAAPATLPAPPPTSVPPVSPPQTDAPVAQPAAVPSPPVSTPPLSTPTVPKGPAIPVDSATLAAVALQVPERRTLPAALSDSERGSLAAAAPAAKFRMVIGPYPTDRITGFTEQSGDFIAELNRLSGGKLDVTVVTDETALPRNEVFRHLRTDRDLIAWHSPSQSASRRTEFVIFAGGVPFGLRPDDHVRWMRGEGADLLERAYAASGNQFRAIPCGIAGSVGAWFRKEMRSPADFRDLKVRATLLMAQSVRKLGANVVTTIASNRDLGAAFAGGRLDANFGLTPLTGVFLVNPRPAAVYHHPGAHHPSYLFDLLIGADTWGQMPEPQRRLIDDACRRNLDRWATFFPSSQNEVIDRIRAQRVIVRPFTGPILEALRKATNEVVAEEAANSLRFKEVLESYNKYRR